ncbi:Para-nitrobenzyl esterase-like protein [Cladobotryum mycophilum]|uniref:Carboxylic ester hydrolase n=1 Tax=Cladobotryum mycophilum TaxID=491253 RepID=A0ABR0SAC6_9HYPO
MLHPLMLVALLAAAVTSATNITHNSPLPPIAITHTGIIRGGSCPNSNVRLFQGIPYAEPPVGQLRFKPPEPYSGPYPKGWFATKPPPACIQWPSAFDVDGPTSEDCLYLNVYIPPDAVPGSDYPVKVWAYGGGNDGGALTLPLYDACNLATDSIVVSFNYRLGPLGFLAFADAGIQGNMAIQDYLAALTWVHLNIRAFGGDRSKVVLFGQSAGADDTFVVSTLPETPHLISAAIMQSGGGMDLIPYETAQYTGRSYAETLKCKNLACLQSKSVKKLIEARDRTPALLDPTRNGGLLSGVFGIDLPNITSLDSPILDGVIIRREPLKAGIKVPVLIGDTERDSTLLVIPYYLSSPSSYPLSEANYTDFLSQWGRFGPRIKQLYPLSHFNAAGDNTTAVISAISHIITVASYNCGAYKVLRTATTRVPAYVYRFNRTLSCPWLWEDGQAFPSPELAPFFGSTHTAELPFIFGNMDKQPWGNGTCNASLEDRELSKTLIKVWTSMAQEGRPTFRVRDWPAFNATSHKGWYIQDKIVVQDIDFVECEFWDGIWAEMGGVIPPWQAGRP